MVEQTTDIQTATTASQMLEVLHGEMGTAGFQHRLDDSHSVSFIARAPKLLVTFEKTADTLAGSDSGLPLGLDFVEDKNWSLLHFATESDSWFRHPAVYRFLDRMVDDAFFEDFDRVTFYGAGMGGYAAAAFSVVAPGAAVLAISPQATLDTGRAPWDTRFPAARRLRFEDRYGYAPDMLEGAGAGVILHDPGQVMDAVHASLFRGANMLRLNCRHFRDHIAASLREMGLLHQIIEMTANQSLTEAGFYRLLRARRAHMRYLRNLLFKLEDAGNPYRTALYCKHVLSRIDAPAFRKRLSLARRTLAERGPVPEWLAES